MQEIVSSSLSFFLFLFSFLFLIPSHIFFFFFNPSDVLDNVPTVYEPGQTEDTTTFVTPADVRKLVQHAAGLAQEFNLHNPSALSAAVSALIAATHEVIERNYRDSTGNYLVPLLMFTEDGKVGSPRKAQAAASPVRRRRRVSGQSEQGRCVDERENSDE